jgi:hypothetical protein
LSSYREGGYNFNISREGNIHGGYLQKIWQEIAKNNEQLSSTTPWKLTDQKEIENDVQQAGGCQ